ncbi:MULTISPECIES: ABC transporter ATP-binding protein [unclassified Gordonia (in: high G+C Gram-positive bacteria)]
MTGTSTTGAVSLRAIRKSFGGVTAVDGVDLDIAAGEFCSLLGASGCGKTTTLRVIAGFERADSGRIVLDGADITDVAPHRRPLNTVFQNYALFPLMTVAENVAFGLKYHRVRGNDARRRVADVLDLVGLSAHATHRPAQLSGGQQQRVALARALVLRPSVLLLDEPMGALDAALRTRLQLELRTLQREVGITFIHVTHDQQEALTMSDRIAIMAGGSIEQIGTPEEVYTAPRTRYVAGFIGSSTLVDVEVLEVSGDRAVCRAFGATIRTVAAPGVVRGAACLVLRPEQVQITEPTSVPAAGDNSIDAVITDVIYQGSSSEVRVRTATGEPLSVEVTNRGARALIPPGTPVQCTFATAAARVLANSARATQDSTRSGLTSATPNALST